MTYIAGFNMPGCLPESDPVEFECHEDARRYLIDELKRQEDEAGAEDHEDVAEDFCHMAEDVNLWSHEDCTPTMPDGYVYWICWVSSVSNAKRAIDALTEVR